MTVLSVEEQQFGAGTRAAVVERRDFFHAKE